MVCSRGIIIKHDLVGERPFFFIVTGKIEDIDRLKKNKICIDFMIASIFIGFIIHVFFIVLLRLAVNIRQVNRVGGKKGKI